VLRHAVAEEIRASRLPKPKRFSSGGPSSSPSVAPRPEEDAAALDVMPTLCARHRRSAMAQPPAAAGAAAVVPKVLIALKLGKVPDTSIADFDWPALDSTSQSLSVQPSAS